MLQNTIQMINSKKKKTPLKPKYQTHALNEKQIKLAKTGATIILGLIAGKYLLHFLSGIILAFHDLVAAIRNQRR